MNNKNESGKKGFTLIEIVISFGILAIIGGLGAYMAIDQYRDYVLDTDKNVVVALLQNARARAMNNINELDHGFTVVGSSYILFQGSSYASRSQSHDQSFPKSAIISTTGITEVVWKRLSGEAVINGGSSIELSNGYRTREITLNNEGKIDW